MSFFPPDSDAIMISSLQHYLFCPRQFALIHQDQMWEENIFTAEGQVVHKRVDSGKNEKRGKLRSIRTLPLYSEKYLLRGVADLVEFNFGTSKKNIYPVEYKKGKPKTHRSDEVQLCAQALCLEEMFECEIAEGFLFYAGSSRRITVLMDAELRDLTKTVIHSSHENLNSGVRPKAVFEKKCENCSLMALCLPQIDNFKSKLTPTQLEED